MAEPEAGTGSSFWRWVERVGWVLGVAAAVVGVLIFLLEYPFVKKERYEELLKLEDRHKRGELIEKASCPVCEDPQPQPEPPRDPWVERATILIAGIDELTQEAEFLERFVEEEDFFARFDRWRSNAKGKLADGQKLISEAGWSSGENWVETFHSQTHINRNLVREPYQPEEYRGFLQSGSQILERMKREITLHSGKRIPPAGSSSPSTGEG